MIGHRIHDYTYRALCISLYMLPTVIIDIIYDFKVSIEETQHIKHLFKHFISKHIHNPPILNPCIHHILKPFDLFIDFNDKSLPDKKAIFYKVMNFIVDNKTQFRILFDTIPSFEDSIKIKLFHFHSKGFVNSTFYHFILFGYYL